MEPNPPSAAAPRGSRLDPFLASYAARARSMTASEIRALFSVASRPEVVSLAGGMPYVSALSLDSLGVSIGALVADRGAEALQYGSGQGHVELREQIAELLMPLVGVQAHPDDVVVTTGSQQGIDMVGRVLLDPGDVAIVEDPTYVGALRALAPTGARIVGVDCDDDGMDTDILAALLTNGMRPKLCYTCANFSNPSGATLSGTRRQHLADLSRRYGFVIVEDDQYGRLRFRGEHIDLLASIADDVVYLSGFSKSVAPGLRVGYLSAPDWLVQPIVLAKQAADLAASSLGQRLVSGLLDLPDWWDGHLALLRGIYAQRSDALTDAADVQLAGRLRVRKPEGGMFVWAEILDDAVTSSALIAAARRLGLALVPGSEFSVTNTFEHALRLSYSTLTPAELGEAVGILAAAFDDIGSVRA